MCDPVSFRPAPATQPTPALRSQPGNLHCLSVKPLVASAQCPAQLDCRAASSSSAPAPLGRRHLAFLQDHVVACTGGMVAMGPLSSVTRQALDAATHDRVLGQLYLSQARRPPGPGPPLRPARRPVREYGCARHAACRCRRQGRPLHARVWLAQTGHGACVGPLPAGPGPATPGGSRQQLHNHYGAAG